MRPKRLDHVVFAVNDLREAAAAWKRVLGLEVDTQLEAGAIQAKLGLVHLGGSGSESAFLELAQPAAAAGPVAEALVQRGEGMLSISIEVDDLDDTVAEHRAKDFAILDVVPGPLPGTRVARIPAEAAHGVRLQFIQRDP